MRTRPEDGSEGNSELDPPAIFCPIEKPRVAVLYLGWNFPSSTPMILMHFKAAAPTHFDIVFLKLLYKC